MRFDLRGNLGDVVLSKNARIIVESVYIPALTNATTRIAVLRLLTSTEDKTFDSKKVLMEIPFYCV
jgi:ribosomal protein L1